MELIEVQLVATEPVHRLVQLVHGPRTGALLGLATDEDVGQRIALQVIAESNFRIGITRSNVDLVDAPAERGLDQPVRSVLIKHSERECAERDHGALVTCPSKTSSFHPSLLRILDRYVPQKRTGNRQPGA